MKTVFFLLLSFALCNSSAFGKWGPATLRQLVGYSDVIALVEFDSELSRNVDGQRVVQSAKLKVVQVFSGKPGTEVVVDGLTDPGLCKAQFVFPATKGARYLVFLNQADEGDRYRVRNGVFGALTVIDEKVKWFSDPAQRQTMADRKLTDLAEVTKQIEAHTPK